MFDPFMGLTNSENDPNQPRQWMIYNKCQLISTAQQKTFMI